MFCTECGTANTATAKFCHACGFGLTSSSPVAQAAPISKAVTVAPAGAVQYATSGRRIAAFLIDALVFNGVSFVAGFLLAFTGKFMLDSFDPSDLNRFFVTVGLVGGWLYYAGLESSTHQATIGKRAVGIRVADAHGRRISFARATGRHFSKLFSALTLGLGFLMGAFTTRRQTLHDLVAGCVVLRSVPTLAASLTTASEARPSLSRTRIVLLSACGTLTLMVGVIMWPTAQAEPTMPTPTRSERPADGDYKRWLAELRPSAGPREGTPKAQSSLPDAGEPESRSTTTLICHDTSRSYSRTTTPWVLRIDKAINTAEMLGHVPAFESVLDGVPTGNWLGRVDVSDRVYSVIFPPDPQPLGHMQFVFKIDRFTGLGKLEIGELKYGDTAKFPIRCVAGPDAPTL